MQEEENDDLLADLVTKIYNKLCSMIRHGELKPGQKLVQMSLAEQLGVSRTPLLQAFGKLNGDHFVVNIPRHGSYVRRFSPQEIINFLDLRILLEPFGLSGLTELTPEQKTNLQSSIKKQESLLDDQTAFYDEDVEFHILLLSLSKNLMLLQLLQPFSIFYQTEPLLKTPKESLEEHRKIVKALAAGNFSKATALLTEHLTYSNKENLENKLKETEE